MSLGWYSASQLANHGWTCGYCGRVVGGSVGYRREGGATDKLVYICPHCENPTAFIMNESGEYDQYPGSVYGHEVDGLPKSVAVLYGEVRRCVQYTAYMSAVLAMRKLLVHIAVERGAEENRSFVSYIDFLDENHWIPPSGREWVDTIRKSGNEATHEIVLANEDDAKQLLDFSEMLLRIVYEFPMKIHRP